MPSRALPGIVHAAVSAREAAQQGVVGNRTLASLYDLISAQNLSVPGRGKDFRGDQRWNTARILVKGNMVEHWLNEF